LAEPTAALGDVALHFERDPDKAEQLLLRSLKLNPAYAQAYGWYGEVLVARGDTAAAQRAYGRAYELDPLSPRITVNYGQSLGHTDPRRAVELYNRALDLSPDFHPAFINLRDHYMERREYAKALDYFRKVATPAWADTIMAGLINPANKPSSLAALARAKDLFATEKATFYMHMGEQQLALAALEEADKRNDPFLVFMHTYTPYAPLRGNPRFERLFKPVHRF
jgi:hypothetical protein